jgi:HAD superfamily hydrolase (TIGR01490 family)
MVSRIERHNRAGHVTVLLSASFEEQLMPAASDLEVARVIGSKAEYLSGRLSGRLEGEACHGPEKARLAEAFCRSSGIDPADCCAYGDSLSDLPILELCGHACVVNGRGELLRLAERRRWEILRIRKPVLNLVKGVLPAGREATG